MPDSGRTTVGSDAIEVSDDGVMRCWWSGTTALYRGYHDHEWGRPVVDTIGLFERICLEGFQSGLSWLTILRKREGFRSAFVGFDFSQVASFDDDDVARLLKDASIVRHEAKIRSVISNARHLCTLLDGGDDLSELLWRYCPEPRSRPLVVTRAWLEATSTTPESVALAKELKRRGWTFVGPTTMYALMQAVGMVNDHQDLCHVRDSVQADIDAKAVP